jgi:hypothetical protein
MDMNDPVLMAMMQQCMSTMQHGTVEAENASQGHGSAGAESAPHGHGEQMKAPSQ